MPRDITITFDDGSTHVYRGAPDDVTPQSVEARASKEFGKRVTHIDGGRKAAAPAAVAQVPNTVRDAPVGQKMLEGARRNMGTIIKTVRPAVEALGGASGAVVGAAAGTVASPTVIVNPVTGALGGAGLGYGIAKRGLDTLETALGYRQGPRSAGEAIVGGAEDVLYGATMEAGGRVVAPFAGRVISGTTGRIADIPRAAERKAAQIVQKAAGEDAVLLRRALDAARNSGQTVGQATADINNPTWQALAAEAAKRDPRTMAATITRQAEESRNALSQLAGGSNAAEVRTVIRGAKDQLNAVTTPMRESALKEADLGPIKADAVRAKLGEILSREEYAGNDLIEGAVKNVGDAIATWTKKNTGAISGAALDSIRKNAVNAAIAKLRPGMDATAQKNAAAGVLAEIKPVIDDAIISAGGKGYAEYLKRHSEGMQRIAQQKLTGEALRLWNTNKPEFVRLVQNESPEVAERFLGKGNYDIAKGLAADAVKVLQGEASKIVRDKAVETQVSQGQEALRVLLAQNKSKLKLPNWFNPAITASNKALQLLERNLNQSTMDALARAMRSPEGAKDLLAALPAEERIKVLKVLRNPQMWEPYGQAVRSGVNALASEDSEPTNSLAGQ